MVSLWEIEQIPRVRACDHQAAGGQPAGIGVFRLEAQGERGLAGGAIRHALAGESTPPPAVTAPAQQPSAK